MHRIGSSQPDDSGAAPVRQDPTRQSRTSESDRPPSMSIPPEVCEVCFSDLVQPLDIRPAGGGSTALDAERPEWVQMTLRCPECHHIRTGECEWDEARRFGRQFAVGRTELRRTLDELAADNLRDEVDCLILALHAELIGPDDFTPYRYAA